MNKWMWRIVILTFISLLIFIAALFLTPSFTHMCTDRLQRCVEDAHTLSLGSKLSATFVCTYNNVLCVLGGVFR